MLTDELIDAILSRAVGQYPPACQEDIDAAEQRLGFPLPSLLKDLYREVGNGGFGPEGSSLIGLEGGWLFYDRYSLVSFYHLRRNDSDQRSFKVENEIYSGWPPFLLPVFCWPCSIYTCLRCDHEQAAVYLYDANFISAYTPDLPVPIIKQSDTFAAWLQDWIQDREIFEQMQFITFREAASYNQWIESKQQ